MKFKDYVKAGFGVAIGLSMARVADYLIGKLLGAIARGMSDESEPEKETKTEE